MFWGGLRTGELSHECVCRGSSVLRAIPLHPMELVSQGCTVPLLPQEKTFVEEQEKHQQQQ